MKPEQELPGILFRCIEVTEKALPIPLRAAPQVRALGRVVLQAEIADLEEWKVVCEKLREIRFAPTDSLLEEMVSVSQARMRAAHVEHARARERWRAEAETLRQRIDFLEAEAQQLRSQLAHARGNIAL